MKDLFFSLIEYKPADNYYTSSDEKLQHLIDLINDRELEEVIKVSWYSSKILGMKLSPVLTNTYIFEKVNNLNVLEKEEILNMLKFVIKDTYTRPDFIGNSLEFYKTYFGKEMKSIPNNLKRTYTKVLESYNDLTLKKFKMKNRIYTLADLIKVFRPNPNKARKLIDKDLYKRIIENNAPLEQETITDILSNKDITSENKNVIINKKIEHMPINQIIKNLKNIKWEENHEIVYTKLKECFGKETALRYLNPYDLIFNSKEIDQRWTSLLDDVLLEWLKTFFEEDNTEYCILFDKSGSMYYSEDIKGLGVESGAKFLSLIIPLLKNYKFYLYDETLQTNKGISKRLKNKATPNQIYNTLLEINKLANNCTYTTECLNECCKENPNANMILVTDEVSYDDAEFSGTNKNPLIVYCTDYVRKGMFDIRPNTLRLAGANGNILPAIQQFLFFDKFLENVYATFDKAYKNRK